MNDKTNKNELYHWGVKGMHWGVRRYQNKDGSLTAAGQKRYERDQRENSGKKKGNKVGQADPNRWVKEDLERTKSLTDASRQMSSNLKQMNKISMDRKARNRPKMDLSSMSDKEMRDQINRAFLEKQYNDLFAPQNESKGRQYVNDILDSAGNILAVTGSALSIALAIKQLKG